MTTRAMSTAQTPPPRHALRAGSAGRHQPLFAAASARVLGDVAVIAITLALAALIAVMLFAPMLP